MKSIIIAGASRSGKTTLAKRLQKETGFSLISADALIGAFYYAFPQLNISSEKDIITTSENFSAFLVDYIQHLRKYQNIPFILDIYHLLPKTVYDEQLITHYKTVFLGYPSISPQQKLNTTRQYQTSGFDWTTEKEDSELLNRLTQYIQWSQKLKADCAKYNLPFFDTSDNFEQVIEEAHAFLTTKPRS